MSKKLGRGLESLFGEGVGIAIDDINAPRQKNNSNDNQDSTEIKLSEIRSNPHQPRKLFDETALNELATSIKEYGVFTPIIVKKAVKGFELVAGERRTKAAKLAGLETVPAIVVDYNDKQMMEVALIENIQREQLNSIEEALAYQEIMKASNVTQAELGDKVGKSRSHIANTLRLLELPSFVREELLIGNLSMGHVKPLIGLTESQCKKAIKEIKENKWNARKVEEYANAIKNNLDVSSTKATSNDTNRYSNVEDTMRQKLGTKIVVSDKEIKIKFNGDRDLNRILEILGMLEN